MKPLYLAFSLCLTLLCLTLVAFETTNTDNAKTEIIMHKDSVLRHVVLFKFKADTSQDDIDMVQEAFSALPSKIPQIASYEWGTNNSPEGLNQDFTHCFFLTFKSEADRAAYLPHPDHKAFGAVLGPHLGGVLVVDYWSHEQ